jgi:hypothetical protein
MARETNDKREGALRVEDETKEWGTHTFDDEHPFADRQVRKKIGEIIAKAQLRRQQKS